jgi:hypothetical protein
MWTGDMFDAGKTAAGILDGLQGERISQKGFDRTRVARRRFDLANSGMRRTLL